MARKSEAAFKRCQECGAVRLASEFKRSPGKPNFGPERPTRCPACGHIGPFLAFVRVEPPAEQHVGED